MQRKAVKNVNIEEEELSTKKFDEHQSAIWKIIPSNKIEGCVCFDPLWYNRYAMKKSDSINRVMQWISNESVFEKRYVFVPLCQANHWNLVVLCNLGHDLNSTRSPCILLLDSLQTTNPKMLEAEIRRFVIDIYKNEHREGYDDICFMVPKVPQQKDGSKCGHYVLYYMYKFMMSCPQHFNIEEDYPGFMDEDWFTDSDVKEFFESIASVSNEDEDDATEKDAMKNGDSEKQQNKGEPELEKANEAVGACTPYAND